MLITNNKFGLSILLFLSVLTILLAWQSRKNNSDAIISYEYNTTPVQAMTNLTLNVYPGSLNQSIESDSTSAAEVALSTVDVFLAPDAGVDSTGVLKTNIRDHRGIAAGWTQTVSCDDFQDDQGNIIDVNQLTITPQKIYSVANSDTTGLWLGSSHNFINPTDVTPIVVAPIGSGIGRFRLESDLALHVSKDVVPGNYHADMTITVS